MNACLQFFRIKDYTEVRTSVGIIRVSPGHTAKEITRVNEHKSSICTLACLQCVFWLSAPTSDTWQLAQASPGEGLACANQPFCWLRGVWSITPDCSRQDPWLPGEPDIPLPSRSWWNVSCSYWSVSVLSVLCLWGSVIPYSGFCDFSPFSCLVSMDSCLPDGCLAQKMFSMTAGCSGFIVCCKAKHYIVSSMSYGDLNEVELLFICFINIKLLEFELNSARITG